MVSRKGRKGLPKGASRKDGFPQRWFPAKGAKVSQRALPAKIVSRKGRKGIAKGASRKDGFPQRAQRSRKGRKGWRPALRTWRDLCAPLREILVTKDYYRESSIYSIYLAAFLNQNR